MLRPYSPAIKLPNIHFKTEKSVKRIYLYMGEKAHGPDPEPIKNLNISKMDDTLKLECTRLL